MAKLGDAPKIKFKVPAGQGSAEGYAVYLGKDPIGYVKRYDRGWWRADDANGEVLYLFSRASAASWLCGRFSTNYKWGVPHSH